MNESDLGQVISLLGLSFLIFKMRGSDSIGHVLKGHTFTQQTANNGCSEVSVQGPSHRGDKKAPSPPSEETVCLLPVCSHHFPGSQTPRSGIILSTMY